LTKAVRDSLFFGHDVNVIIIVGLQYDSK